MADAALFTRRRRHTLVADVADDLRRRIVSGDLSIGRQLPAIRRLARLYGVSQPTMWAALRALESVGYLSITHGVGTFVAKPRDSSRVLVYAWKEATDAELAAMRAAIDEVAPVLAARTARAAGPRRLPRAVADLPFLAGERSSSRLWAMAEGFVRADLAFHRTILTAAHGSEASASLFEEIGRRLQPRLTHAAGIQARDEGLDQAHLALASAIREGHMRAAARLGSAIARREMDSLHAPPQAG
jgi:DNA-binding FadR family transcriptional regulator